MFCFSFDISFVIISAVFTKGVYFVVKKLVVSLSINMVRPPTQSKGAVIVWYDLGFSGQVRKAQAVFRRS